MQSSYLHFFEIYATSGNQTRVSFIGIFLVKLLVFHQVVMLTVVACVEYIL